MLKKHVSDAKAHKLLPRLDPREVRLHKTMRRKFADPRLACKLVTVIAVVKNDTRKENLFANYEQQKYSNKELIIILSGLNQDINAWLEYSQQYYNVQIFQLSDALPPGDCLNFALHKSSGNYLARFDEDCYYGPDYLSDLVTCFAFTEAAVVGKVSYFIYLPNYQQLALYNAGKGFGYVNYLLGLTHLVKREVFERMPQIVYKWADDQQFCRECSAAGFRLYAGDPFNFYQHVEQEYASGAVDEQEFTRQHGTLLLTTEKPAPYVTFRTRKRGD